MPKLSIWSPSNLVSIITQIRCGNVYGLVSATPTGSSYGSQKVNKEPTMPKLEWLLQYFMLKLAAQHRLYVASLLYI